MQNYCIKCISILIVILSTLAIPTIGIPQSSSSGTTYYQQDLPQNIRPYIDEIHFDPTSDRYQGVQVKFKDVPPISSAISRDIANFIVNNPSWKGSRSSSEVSNEILAHWGMARGLGVYPDGFDDPRANRQNAVSPIHVEYSGEDQSTEHKVAFAIGGPIIGLFSDVSRVIDGQILVEDDETVADSTPSRNTNYPYQWQGQSVRPWYNLDESSGSEQPPSPSTESKFVIGSRIKTTDSLNVRSGPGLSYDTAGATRTAGNTGTILSNPISADGFTWWEIQYDDGTRGWSQEKRLESVSIGQQATTQPPLQSTTNEVKAYAVETYKPTYHPTETVYEGLEPIQLSSQPEYQHPDAQQDDQMQAPLQPYSSIIPSDSAHDTKYFSSVDPLPGKVPVYLDIRDENGNIPPAGTSVTVIDGEGNYIRDVTWDSSGHTLVQGAPGSWTITVNAPGYKINTGYTTVPSSSSSTSFRMNLMRQGTNDQTVPIISPQITQIASQQTGPSTIAKVPLELDIRDENGNVPPAGTQVIVQDGSGNQIQVNWDSNGHALAYGAPGIWTITANAPGYSANINDVLVSSESSHTSSRIYLQRRGAINRLDPISSPSLAQSTSQTVAPDYSGLSKKQKDDILVSTLESRTQGRELSEEEANQLMDDLDALQRQLYPEQEQSDPGGFE